MTPIRLPGYRRVRQAGRWLRSRLRPHVVILGYHRVSESPHDPYDFAVTRAQLDAHLSLLAREARVVSLGQAARELAEGVIVDRTVAVTFDDGYRDTVDEVLPLLRRHGVPATVFVTPGNPGRPFWWDAVAALVSEGVSLPESLVVATADPGVRFPTNDRVALLRALGAHLRPLGAPARDHVVATIAAQVTGAPAPEARALTRAETVQLADDPLVEIGAHSLTHPLLAGLSPDEQRAEIIGSRVALEEVTGRPVRLFSYPHGSFTPVTQAILREAGFVAACTSDVDVATADSDPLMLPRLWVDGPRKRRFATWMTRWLSST